MHPEWALRVVLLVPLTAACIATAAQAYGIPEAYLYAILAVEGGHVGEAVPDKNGTSDLGPFQINSSWVNAIARYWRIPVADALVRVRDDGCANAVIATAILKRCANETGGDMAAALGLYHSHSLRLAEGYRAKALAMLGSMAASSGPDQR
jgi:hypothetical protein